LSRDGKRKLAAGVVFSVVGLSDAVAADVVAVASSSASAVSASLLLNGLLKTAGFKILD